MIEKHVKENQKHVIINGSFAASKHVPYLKNKMAS
jgi:hypothetical protein